MSFIVICIIIVIVLLLMSILNNNKKGKKRCIDNENKMEEQKVLKYFGGAYCPHSREGSRAYNLMKDFEATYPNVDVQYYWSGNENDKSEFMKADARYVPTLTNSLYNKVEMSVSPKIDTTDKSQDELKELVMINMYDQLN